MITEPTRVTVNSQTLLDVILTNNPELFKKCGIYNPEISDHSMIYGEMVERVHISIKLKLLFIGKLKRQTLTSLTKIS